MLIGVDTETQDDTIWCAAVATDQFRMAGQQLNGDIARAIDQNTPIFHSASFDKGHLRNRGIWVDEYEDTLLLAHMLGYKPLNLPTLSALFLGQRLEKEMVRYKEGKAVHRFEEDPQQVLEMCSMDAWSTYMLYQQMRPQMKPEWMVLYEKEKELQTVLSCMYDRGLPISPHRVHDLRQQLLRKMGRIEAELAAEDIDVTAQDALREAFWRGKTPRYSKSGDKLSLSKDNLKECATKNDWWVAPYIEWKEADKFVGTYLNNWVAHEWLHPSLNQTGPVTWRFSCSNPNLQNVPKSKAAPLYQLFVAPEGFTFISADYSQLELRVLANLTKDPDMMSAYLSGADLHHATVERLELVKKMGGDADKARRFAKTINFGIAYGISPHGLAPRLDTSKEIANTYIEGFYESYQEVRPWQQQQLEHAIEYGYVETSEGRPLWVPCTNAEEGKLYYHGKNQCCNYPIQGTAAEIVKDAMLRCPRYMVMQVHDELLYLVPNAEVHEYKEFLSRELVDYRHEVPYTVDMEVGRTWGDIKSIPDMWLEDDDE